MKRLSKPIFSKQTFLDIKKILNSGNLVNGKYAKTFEKQIYHNE